MMVDLKRTQLRSLERIAYRNNSVCCESAQRIIPGTISRFNPSRSCHVLLFVVSITYFSLFRVAFAFGNVLAVIMIMKSFNMFSITEAAARRL